MRNKIAILFLAFALLLSPVSAYALEWEQLPWATKENLDKGQLGGEVSQWIQTIAMDSEDGQFMLAGTDVGGILRSYDGGETWAQASLGLESRGVTGAAIDPFNSNRAIIVGANDPFYPKNGLYLTTDKAQTWQSVLPINMSGYRDVRSQLAYDESSFSEPLGYTTTAYWLRRAGDDRGGSSDPGLYKTTDGGVTWTLVRETDEYGNAYLKVHPVTGDVFLGARQGVFKSSDGGMTFEEVASPPEGMEISGIDLVKDDEVVRLYYNLNGGGIFVSDNSSEGDVTFEKIASTGLPPTGDITEFKGHMGIKVSPVNPDRMAMMVANAPWTGDKYYSHDGGITWHKGIHDRLGGMAPYNGRDDNLITFHPTDEDIIWASGGDWLNVSTDGGATYRWANDGNNGVMTGDLFNFNVTNPDLLYVGSQDYAGALTENGGVTWKYANAQGYEWGGLVYGAYAASPQVLFGGGKGGAGRTLHVSRDGGDTFTEFPDVVLNGFPVSYGDPRNELVMFSYEYFSTDGGYTWYKMDGAQGVFTHNYDPYGDQELIGASTSAIVISKDHGETWEKITSFSGSIQDIAYDWQNKLYYIAARDELWVYDVNESELRNISESIPADQNGNKRFSSVAVDPVEPHIVYAVGPANVYNSTTAVKRSVDAGASWQVLTRNLEDGEAQSIITSGLDGGREATAVRVHPVTRYAYIGTGCFGMWKMAPPGHAEDDYGKPALLGYAGNGETTLRWFGNGRTDLLKLAQFAQAYADPEITSVDLYDLDGDRSVNSVDLSLVTDHVFKDSAKMPDVFEIYRQGEGESDYKLLTSTSNTAYTDTDVENDQSYSYKVVNTRTGKDSKRITLLPGDAEPAFMSATKSASYVELNWQEQSGVYHVYRSEAADGEYVRIADGLTKPYYRDSDMAAGTVYYYYVTSEGASGEGKPSAVKQTLTYIPDPPRPPKPPVTFPQGHPYTQTFDNGVPENWAIFNQMKVEDGKLAASWGAWGGTAIYEGDSYTGDYEFSIDMYAIGNDSSHHAQILFNYADMDKYYYLDVSKGGADGARLLRKEGNDIHLLGEYSGPNVFGDGFVQVYIKYEKGGFITVKATKNETETTLFDRLEDTADGERLAGGYIGVRTEWSADQFDNLVITPLTNVPVPVE
jgi:photosystem II stability/assembly factor-like uncharacterized protein